MSSFQFSQGGWVTIQKLQCSSLASHGMALLKLILTPNLHSTLTRCGQHIQGFIPQNCIHPPQTDITYFYAWALIIFLLCIKHGKPVPINVLMICCDFLKVWQQRGEIKSLGAALYCGVPFSPEIYNFMHVEKNVKET